MAKTNHLKRIHLFEVIDHRWFPDLIRQCTTRLIVVMHKILGSPDELAELIGRALGHSTRPAIIDLCSGSGGPMIEVFKAVKAKHKIKNLTLTLTDLYPNYDLAATLNSETGSGISYLTDSVNAASIDPEKTGVRTMVSSMHHMMPEIAHKILKDAKENRQPICIFEISDNSFPIWLWWIAIPLNFLMALFITPLVKPITWEQLVFTYIVPVVPLCFAWDGAVSNARTYTLTDLDQLLDGLESDNYKWEKGRIGGKLKKLYLLGLPVSGD